MSVGLFSVENWMLRRIPTLVPRCGPCGLYKHCKPSSAKMPPSGRGRKRILICGEGQGKTEEDRGIQFCGESGQLLQRTLSKFGVDFRRDCWVTNAIACRAKDSKGGNRTPTDLEIDHCRPLVIKAIQELKPETVILLGGPAVKSVLGWLWREGGLGSVSRWDGWQIPCRRINAWICPTWHPAAILRTDYGVSQKENEVRRLFFERHLKAACSLEGRPWETAPDYESKLVVELDDRAAARGVDAMAESGKPIAWDLETNMLKPYSVGSEIYSCSVSDGERSIAFPWYGRAVGAVLRFLKSDVPVIGANIKFEGLWMLVKHGFLPRNWRWDVVNVAHLLDNRPGIAGVEFQAFVNLGVEPWDAEVGPYLRSKNANEVNRIKKCDLRKVLRYNAMDSMVEWWIADRQAKVIGIELC